MNEERKKMNDALKSIVVPYLREKGFKGSFPHFRRASDTKIDLLTFQFDKRGGGFVIEISKCPPDGIMTHWGEHIPPNKVRAWDMHPNIRLRLKPSPGGSTRDWFRYDTKPLLYPDNIYVKIARSVLLFLEEAEQWWNENK